MPSIFRRGNKEPEVGEDKKIQEEEQIKP